MTAALARALMALACRCLGASRRDWALAMQAEFEAAREDGRPLAFALGCLIAAGRELPAHEEGRFAIASHVLALALILPVSALLLSGLLGAFPHSSLSLDEAGGHIPILNEANLSAVPALTVLLTVLVASHLRVAWLVLERDWAGVAAVAALVTAATVTLALFTGVVFGSCAVSPSLAAALAAELIALSALARWHARSLGAGAPA